MSGSENNSLKPWDTEFNKQSGWQLQFMLLCADVDNVYDVAQNWLDVHDQLVGEEGDDGAGVRGRLVKAVKKVRETWHGKSAEKFSEEAGKVIENIGRGGRFAKNVSGTMVEAAEALSTANGKMAKVDWDPPAWGSPYIEYEQAIQDGNFKDPDLEMWSQWIGKDRYRRLGDGYKEVQAQLATGLSAKQVLETWEEDADKDLVRGELWMPKFQRQALEAAAAMETLATSYKKQTRNLKPPEDIKGARPPGQRPPGGGPLGSISKPTGQLPGGGKPPTGLISGGAPGGSPAQHGPGWSPPDVPGASHGPGWSGGGGGPDSPPISTGLDSFPSGGGPSGAGGGGLPSGGYGGHGGGPVSPGGSSGGGYTGGLPGMPSGLGPSGRPSGSPGPRSVPSPSSAGRSGPGAPGGTSGARTGSGPGAGRSGMPGMAGVGGAGAAAGKGAAAGRGTGGTRAGGRAGSPSGGAAGGIAQGGSGLHRSRGGSAAAARNGSAAGMPGAPGAYGAGAQPRTGRSGRDDRRRNYLVEDEETWVPRRNTVPRVIE